MATTLERLCVESLYEVFIYLQFHEVFNSFSNLNSRFTAIINNMSFMPVYLGLDGMNIASTEFYYTHLSQPNTCNRLISLCVSDTLAIDNGLWLASHISTFINLHHLSLIDIKHSSFELILNAFSPSTPLVMFSVRFSTYNRAAYTFESVPEGAYYERIFRLFPLLRSCHLGFWRYIYNTLDSQLVLPFGKPFMPIQTNLLNLQSLVLRLCSPGFLSHLLEHLPQLEEVSFELSTHWLSDKHSLMQADNNRISLIDKRLAPNLQRLKITGDVPVERLDSLFSCDVLFSLTKFTLKGFVSGPHVIQNLLSILSDRCLYVLVVRWSVQTVLSPSNTSYILLETFQQLKGRVPIELELSLYENRYSIRALTVPRMDICLSVHSYLHKNTVLGQSRWPNAVRVLSNCFVRVDEITMVGNYPQLNNEFLSYSPPIVSWHQITLLNIYEPFDLAHLHLLFSQAINLRTLKLSCRLYFDSKDDLKDQSLIDLLNDASLCNMLMSNGLRQLTLFFQYTPLNLIEIANLIVEQLSLLQVIELHCSGDQVPIMLHIFMKGLSKLNFLTIHGLRCDNRHNTRSDDYQNSFTRPYRMEVYNVMTDEGIVYIWL